jgi:hypothetical protein
MTFGGGDEEPQFSIWGGGRRHVLASSPLAARLVTPS